MKLIKQSSIKTSLWSGGSTSQLYIYPPDSEYKKLDFFFRLSRATIEVQESNFTPLARVKRKLMVLQGELKLIHKNHYSKELKALEYDTFLGDWQTRSQGIATDFNLMMLGDTGGELSVIKSKKSQIYSYKMTFDFTIFYVDKGILELLDSNVREGELLVFESHQYRKIDFNLKANSTVIVVEINL